MENKKFSRKCNHCGSTVLYTRKSLLTKAEESNSKCKECRRARPPFSRKCPLCQKNLFYTNVKNRNSAEKRKTVCCACSLKEIKSRPEVWKIIIEKQKKRTGEKNSFFGKHHTKKSKKIMSQKMNERVGQYKTEEFRKKMSAVTKGEKNGMYGKTIFGIWKEKYGEKQAKIKFNKLKKKISKNTSGKNNPMYGKPAPIGSGGGWGGWYSGWYFRSLRELSYMISVIEKKNYSWKNAEKIPIPYIDYDGKQRTYRADFLLNDKILIEIKPKKLMSTPNNIIKKEAATNFCKKSNLEYRMVDIKILKTDILINLFKENKVKFNKKYTKVMENMICKLEKK